MQAQLSAIWRRLATRPCLRVDSRPPVGWFPFFRAVSAAWRLHMCCPGRPSHAGRPSSAWLWRPALLVLMFSLHSARVPALVSWPVTAGGPLFLLVCACSLWRMNAALSLKERFTLTQGAFASPTGAPFPIIGPMPFSRPKTQQGTARARDALLLFFTRQPPPMCAAASLTPPTFCPQWTLRSRWSSGRGSRASAFSCGTLQVGSLPRPCSPRRGPFACPCLTVRPATSLRSRTRAVWQDAARLLPRRHCLHHRL